jgi:hypothetical protein
MSNKAMSGRWLVTVSVAIVFVYCSVYKILSPSDIKEIIRDVILFYFVVKGVTDNTKGNNVQKPN